MHAVSRGARRRARCFSLAMLYIDQVDISQIKLKLGDND